MSVLLEDMSFEIFSPIWSYVNENDKKNCKKSKFENQQKNCLAIWWIGTFPKKIGVNSFSALQWCLRKRGLRTDDGRPRDLSPKIWR